MTRSEHRKNIYDWLYERGFNVQDHKISEFSALLKAYANDVDSDNAKEIEELKHQVAKAKGKAGFFYKKLKSNNLI